MTTRTLEQILYEKELELAQVREQVKALKFVVPLLMEQYESEEALRDRSANEAPKNRWPLQLA